MARPSGKTVNSNGGRRKRSANSLALTSPKASSRAFNSVRSIGRDEAWICTAFRPHRLTGARALPFRWAKSRLPHVGQSASRGGRSIWRIAHDHTSTVVMRGVTQSLRPAKIFKASAITILAFAEATICRTMYTGDSIKTRKAIKDRSKADSTPACHRK